MIRNKVASGSHRRIFFVFVVMLTFPIWGCSTTHGVDTLAITTWGPQSTQEGTAFNAQPDGGAAFWVNVNRQLDYKAIIVFNSVKLKSAVTGKLITAAVPANLYTKAGTYPLYVVDEVNGKEVKSNSVDFVVTTK
jgi:hypothetical protein